VDAARTGYDTRTGASAIGQARPAHGYPV